MLKIKLKTLKTFCILYLLCLGVFTNAPAQSNFNYDYTDRDDISPGYPDSGIEPYYWNNGIVAIGFCTDSLSNYGMTLTFKDTIGNIIWQKITFLPSYQIQGNAIVSYNNSGFFIAGFVISSTNQSDFFFAKFDSNGDSLFYKIFPDTADNVAVDMIPFSSDTLLVLTNWKVNAADEYNRHIIYRLDTLGNIISSDSSSLAAGRSGNQILKANNKVYVAGTRKTAPGSTYNVKIFIDVYDDNLNILTTWNPSTTMNEYFAKLNILNNNVYVTSAVTAYNPPNPNAFFQFRIGFLNSIGNYQTYQNFGPLDFNPAGGRTCVVNQNCLVAPITYSGNDLLYFIDSSCNILCSAYIACPGTYTVHSEIVITPSHKIAGTGNVFNYPFNPANTQDHWNFLTEPVEIFLTTNCGVGITEATSDSDFLVYPNPNNGKMDIKLNGGGYDYIHIFNSVGQEIYLQELNSHEHDQQITIALENVANGLYIIQVVSKNGTYNKKVLIEK